MDRSKLNKKIIRITENVYDVMLNTNWSEEAQRMLRRDLIGHNISVDKNKGLITIETLDGTRVLYEIRFSRKGGKLK